MIIVIAKSEAMLVGSAADGRLVIWHPAVGSVKQSQTVNCFAPPEFITTEVIE